MIRPYFSLLLSIRLGENVINGLMKVSGVSGDVPPSPSQCWCVVKLLSLLPATVAPKWRIHMVKKAWSMAASASPQLQVGPKKYQKIARMYDRTSLSTKCTFMKTGFKNLRTGTKAKFRPFVVLLP